MENTYLVTIKATHTKTYRIEASDQSLAESIAQEIFNDLLEEDVEQEEYTQETIDIKLL